MCPIPEVAYNFDDADTLIPAGPMEELADIRGRPNIHICWWSMPDVANSWGDAGVHEVSVCRT